MNDLLKGKGLKATSSRLAVLGAFSGECMPLNAEGVAKKLRTKDLNLVTVYRTLASFEEAGLLKRIDLHKDSAYYELAGHHHHHVICKGCGLIESLGGCDAERLSKNVLKKASKFSLIKEHSLEFFGVCKKCAYQFS